MAEAISDAAVVAVLRPFARAARPVLGGLRDADPFGLRARMRGVSPGSADERGLREKVLDLLASVKVPGTAAWAAMDVEARCRWWIYRVGRFTTVIAAVPGLGGAVANKLPVSDTMAAAGQGLLLCAIAGEHGITDEETLVALLAAVLFRRDLTPRALSPADDAAVAAQAAELTGDLADTRSTVTPRRVAAAVWRLGRALFACSDELDKRPHGRFYHGAVQLLPVVGVAGRYFGEWSGLKRASKEAHRWLAARWATHLG
ncbi:hypothetical protein [Pseudonocardia asaccharolytica]|uniref:Uncharacterized protein n=1 Tax=Pseudonocardia asaccharolytica DSM 44247 = NBRC 16224 TaxID=1123024 RepID=A0A511D1K8_9PSEU|nr:hypothetical protein [Pseudonocardia asaccharolytica]GEL18567.1 hypothetical protein PA7_24040 [Pseudonocardia asaccharolytica DSM 44247 = NBRC 16224]